MTVLAALLLTPLAVVGAWWALTEVQHLRHVRTCTLRPCTDPKHRMGTPVPAHDCGMCDGPLAYAGRTRDGIALWRCTVCPWRHTSRDCCQTTIRRGGAHR